MPDENISTDSSQISAGSESSPATTGDVGASTPSSEMDSAVSTQADAPSIDTAAGTDTGAATGQEQTDAQPMSEEEFKAFEAEVEQAVANEQTPDWFRNAAKQYKRYVSDIGIRADAFKPLETYGGVEKITADLELARLLNTTRDNPQTGFPEKSTIPFLEKLEDDTRLQLLNDLSSQPSPFTAGYTLMQEVLKQTGIPPERLQEVQTFLKNGYPSGSYPRPSDDELAVIPEHLRSTYADLSPDHRDELNLVEKEGVRNDMLENAKFKMEQDRVAKQSEQEKEQQQELAKQKADFEFRQEVYAEGTKNFEQVGEKIFASFKDSLISQAGMSPLDAMMVTNTVVNTFDDTLAGRQSLEALKAAGIDYDSRIPQTVKDLEQVGRHIAYYKKMNDETNLKSAVTTQVELQERLTAYGNKLVASLAKQRSGTVANAANQHNAMLDGTTNVRPGINGQPAAIQNGRNFDDMSYSQLLAQDQHFTKQRS